MTTAQTPVRLNRAALERALQRATALQAAERDVGIPAVCLRQALLGDQVRGASGPTGLAGALR